MARFWVHAEVVVMVFPLKMMPYTNAMLKGVFCVSHPNDRVLPPVIPWQISAPG